MKVRSKKMQCSLTKSCYGRYTRFLTIQTTQPYWTQSLSTVQEGGEEFNSKATDKKEINNNTKDSSNSCNNGIL